MEIPYYTLSDTTPRKALDNIHRGCSVVYTGVNKSKAGIVHFVKIERHLVSGWPDRLRYEINLYNKQVIKIVTL